VKSAIVATKEALPRIFNFKNDVDTLEIISDKNEASTEINVNFADETIAGDVADWLQRLPYSIHFSNVEKGLLLKIVGIKQEELETIEKQLNRFELNFIIQKNDID
jgi:glutamyl-tRNA reductase